MIKDDGNVIHFAAPKGDLLMLLLLIRILSSGCDGMFLTLFSLGWMPVHLPCAVQLFVGRSEALYRGKL